MKCSTDGGAERTLEFVLSHYGPISRLAPTTPRAQAWLEFHGLSAVMARADAIADGKRFLADILTELLVADLESEAQR